jgi:outer membrane receptor protein involved in Fe transport
VIRGLSPTRGRQNVAILQDDVDISSMAQGTGGGSFVINPRLQDLERVEVVKGPHSALYGRSAFNGAINYITRQPGDEFRGNAQLTLGDYDKREARLSVSGPVIAGKLSRALNLAGWNDGGFYKSPTTGEGLGGGDDKGVAFTLRATPVDWITITRRSEYSRDDFGSEASSIRNPVDVPVPANASDFPAPSPGRNPRTGVDYSGSSRDIFRTTLRVEFNFEPVTLTSISHVGDNKTFQFNDALLVGDYANPLISAAHETCFETQIDLVSQELRLQSKSEGPLLWTVGGP